MTRISIAGLERGPARRTLRLDPADGELGDLPLPFGVLDVRVEARRAEKRSVRVRGSVTARARVPCRRCLEPTEVEVRAEWDALFREAAGAVPGEDGVWPLEASAGEVDVAGPLREELWMAAPAYAQCASRCPGLCPGCGASLAAEACDCPPPTPDPRWAALRPSPE